VKSCLVSSAHLGLDTRRCLEATPRARGGGWGLLLAFLVGARLRILGEALGAPLDLNPGATPLDQRLAAPIFSAQARRHLILRSPIGAVPVLLPGLLPCDSAPQESHLVLMSLNLFRPCLVFIVSLLGLSPYCFSGPPKGPVCVASFMI
jgi:hypothetical protein